MNDLLAKFYCAVFLLTGWVSAQAVTLNWGDDFNDNANWNNGDLSDSFNIDTSNSGNDVTITISGDTGDLVSNVDDNTNLTGGGGSGNESLYLAADYDAPGDNEIIVRIQFNYTQDVSQVSFYIYDVDRTNGQWIDLISNFQVYRGGTLQTGVFPTLTAGSDNTVENAGTSSVQVRGTGTADDSSDDGNVFVDFGDAVFDEIRFTWTNEDANLGNQWIGLHNIDYSPAPEPATVVTGALLLGFAGLRTLRKKRSFPLSETA